MFTNFSIFLSLLRRDVSVFGQQIKTHGINNGIIYPLMYAFAFAYLQTQSYFTTSMMQERTTMFIGNILLLILISCFHFTFPLLFDLQGKRSVNYLLQVASLRILFLEKIFFATCATFVLTSPFIPLCKLILGKQFDTNSTNWFAFFIILFLGSLCVSTYYFLAVCCLKNAHQINNFWVRFNIPLTILGGYWTPWYTTLKVSSLLGWLCLLNPFLYITEGARQAILTDEKFLPLSVCAGALICFSLIFTQLIFYFFKKKIDCI